MTQGRGTMATIILTTKSIEYCVQMETNYLSPYVQSMWLKFNSEIDPRRSDGVLRLHFDRITIDEKSIPDDLVDVRDEIECRYVKAGEMIASLARQIRSAYCQMDRTTEQKLEAYLRWTANADVFMKAFKSIERHEGDSMEMGRPNLSNVAMAMLRCTAELEWALGNVFMLGEQRGLVPRLTKDLLASEQLANIFGPSIMSLVHVLMGSPHSVNARNVIWHGFAAPSQIPHNFVYLIVALVATLGRILERKELDADFIPRRPLVKIERFSERLRGIFPDLRIDFGRVRHVLESSSFVPQSMLPYWTDALTLMEQRRFGESLVLILPQLEHSLRCLFVKLNDCQERFQTAQSKELYTTFEEILAVRMPNGAPNAMISFLGEQTIVALKDLFFYPDGPRLRDRLGHGEICVQEIDWPLANHVLSIALYFALLFIDEERCSKDELRSIKEAMHNYRTVYHPFGLVTSLIVDAHSSIVGLMSHISEPDLVELERRSGNILSALRAAFDIISDACHLTQFVKILVECHSEAGAVHLVNWTKSQRLCSILHRPPVELEFLRSMRRTLDTMMDIAKQVKLTLDEWQRMFENHRLRSRQRETYFRIKTSVPTVNYGLRFILVFFCITIGNFDRVQLLDSEHQIALKRFLIRIERYAESIRSSTSPDRNRWEKCESLSLMFLDELLKRLHKTNKLFIDEYDISK